jgi:signal transduction histidine kinase
VFLITVLDLTLTREDLFKKFTKMGKLGTSNEGSTGIGLYLCRNIVKKNHNFYSKWGQNKRAIFNIVQTVILFLTDTDCRSI